MDLALNSDTVSMFVWPLKEDQVVIPLHHLGSLRLYQPFYRATKDHTYQKKFIGRMVDGFYLVPVLIATLVMYKYKKG